MDSKKFKIITPAVIIASLLAGFLLIKKYHKKKENLNVSLS